MRRWTRLDPVILPKRLVHVRYTCGSLATSSQNENVQRLREAAHREYDLPLVQRLGFLLERIAEDAKSEPLAGWKRNSRVRNL